MAFRARFGVWLISLRKATIQPGSRRFRHIDCASVYVNEGLLVLRLKR
jgi:hypothetical protein